MRESFYERIGESCQREKLANGLTVCVVPKPGYRRKYAFFAARYGGMDVRFRLDGQWRDTPAGIAHYLEHKMFDTKDGSAMQDLAKNGAEPNAFTASAMTGYYFDCTEHFEENLKILLRFVSTPYFTQESVEKERGIIGQEIRMVEDNPDWQIYQQLLQALYARHSCRIPIAGTVESIADITPQTLYDCHKAFYTPGNMVLTVVGDVRPERVFEAAERILPRESGPEIERDYGREPEAVCRRESVRRMEVSAPQFLLGFKCPAPERGESGYRTELLGDLAWDILLGESSPLYQRLYEDGTINGSFGGAFDTLPGAACLYAGGDCKEPGKVAEAILRETERLDREGIDPDYWQRMRRAAFGSTLRGLNSFENIAVGLAEGYFQAYDAFDFPRIYESIRQEDILTFLRENVREERMALSRILPGEQQGKEGNNA